MSTIAILGAGLMGHGIAQIFAAAGHAVRLFDQDPAVLASAPQRIRANLRPFLELGLMAPDQVEPLLARVQLCPDLASLCAGCDLVIEAISENLELKRKVFTQVETLAPPTAILASNTSAISIGLIAEALTRPERMLGTHFWNPPQVVPCVEIIEAPRTDPAVADQVADLMAGAGKKPVRVKKDIPGFLGNRMQHALWREAIALVQAGVASPEDVDAVVRYGFGLRLAYLGPLATADLAGLDLTCTIHEDLLKELDRSQGPAPLLAQKVRDGQVGAKSGQGFHAWTPESVQAVVQNRDKALLKILREALPGDAQ
ncbi:MAG: 3-hydroxyacyl-CoA dehydrogenase NAD-binding domain-containing protein [Pseudomonadota bacterium]